MGADTIPLESAALRARAGESRAAEGVPARRPRYELPTEASCRTARSSYSWRTHRAAAAASTCRTWREVLRKRSARRVSTARAFVSPDSRWIAAIGPDTRVHLYPLGGGSADRPAGLPALGLSGGLDGGREGPLRLAAGDSLHARPHRRRIRPPDPYPGPLRQRRRRRDFLRAGSRSLRTAGRCSSVPCEYSRLFIKCKT